MADASMTLMQWLSPGFPIGAFAYSHGLEERIAARAVSDAARLQAWLADLIDHGAVRADIVLLAAAYRASPDDLPEIDEIARALCPSAERLQETDLQGAAFVDTVNAVWGLDLPRLAYPVAVGAAAARRSVPPDLTAALFAQAFVANLVSAAVRLVPLGQTEGQAVVAALAPRIHTVAREAQDTGIDDIGSASFAADIASMRHETLEPRIFRT